MSPSTREHPLNAARWRVPAALNGGLPRLVWNIRNARMSFASRSRLRTSSFLARITVARLSLTKLSLVDSWSKRMFLPRRVTFGLNYRDAEGTLRPSSKQFLGKDLDSLAKLWLKELAGRFYVRFYLLLVFLVTTYRLEIRRAKVSILLLAFLLFSQRGKLFPGDPCRNLHIGGVRDAAHVQPRFHREIPRGSSAISTSNNFTLADDDDRLSSQHADAPLT